MPQTAVTQSHPEGPVMDARHELGEDAVFQALSRDLHARADRTQPLSVEQGLDGQVGGWWRPGQGSSVTRVDASAVEITALDAGGTVD